MKIIGITGGSGAGKTTVLMVLEELGAKVIDCDRIYHELMDSCKEMRSSIEKAFPECISDGKIAGKPRRDRF
jgi:dephospho-CoA kinase